MPPGSRALCQRHDTRFADVLHQLMCGFNSSLMYNLAIGILTDGDEKWTDLDDQDQEGGKR